MDSVQSVAEMEQIYDTSDITDADLTICGALQSPKDDSDWIFESLAQGANGTARVIPDEFDLREYMQPSRNQGTRGTCAAFTAAAIKEIQEAKKDVFNDWMSPEFIYYHRNNKPRTGMYGRNVFEILKTIGSVPESAYPYKRVEKNNLPAPSAELYETASQFRIAGFARVTTIEGLKRALLELGPCYLLLPLHRTRPEFWRAVNKTDTSNGGHAVVVIGYTIEGFILKNSWGRKWNNDGTIVFPYVDWGAQLECWVTIDETNKEVIKPYNSKRRSVHSRNKLSGNSRSTHNDQSVKKIKKRKCRCFGI